MKRRTESRAERRIERHTARVMAALSAGDNAPAHAIDLMRRTGLGTGALYTAIARAQRQGWLERTLAAPSTPEGHQRALYALSPQGNAALPQVLEQARQEPMPRRWRWSWLSR